jgi:23S rRNA pseudouridine1911/1915/1917 synthase
VITVDPESAGQRLDVFLADNLGGNSRYSRSYLKRLIEEHHVQVEGRSVRASHRLRAGERVSVWEPPARPAVPSPQHIPLRILHEDRDLVVLDKPAGLVVHPAPGNPNGTLVNALLHHCNDLSGIGGTLRPGIVHRLDRGTSGVIVATKNDRAHRKLASQFHEHQTRKQYIAFAGRRPGAGKLPDSGSFETMFGRHPVHRKRFSSRVEHGKTAHTNYRVLQRFEGDDWMAVKIELEPVTGRTHQLRVHLADASHPILGDKLYGGRSSKVFPKAILPDRPALHARLLSFLHPADDRRMSFEAPLPDDLLELESRLAELSV